MSDQFPHGRLSADDEGVLDVAIAVKAKTVIISFSKPVAWVGLDKATALAFAEAVRAKAEEIR